MISFNEVLIPTCAQRTGHRETQKPNTSAHSLEGKSQHRDTIHTRITAQEHYHTFAFFGAPLRLTPPPTPLTLVPSMISTIPDIPLPLAHLFQSTRPGMLTTTQPETVQISKGRRGVKNQLPRPRNHIPAYGTSTNRRESQRCESDRKRGYLQDHSRHNTQ